MTNLVAIGSVVVIASLVTIVCVLAVGRYLGVTRR